MRGVDALIRSPVGLLELWDELFFESVRLLYPDAPVGKKPGDEFRSIFFRVDHQIFFLSRTHIRVHFPPMATLSVMMPARFAPDDDFDLSGGSPLSSSPVSFACGSVSPVAFTPPFAPADAAAFSFPAFASLASKPSCSSLKTPSTAAARAKAKSSGFRGVSRCSKDGRWQARIRVGKRVKYLGRYKSESEAALKYDEAALALHGRRAILNFELSADEFATASAAAAENRAALGFSNLLTSNNESGTEDASSDFADVAEVASTDVSDHDAAMSLMCLRGGASRSEEPGIPVEAV